MSGLFAFLVAAAPVISTVLTVAGVVTKAGAQKKAGDIAAAQGAAEQEAAKADARAFERRALQEFGAGVRGATEQRKRTQHALSRLQALAAASGGGAAGPTIERLAMGIASEGEARALYQLYVGKAQAITDIESAENRRLSGVAAFEAGRKRQQYAYVGAAGELLTGIGGTLLDKYGGSSTPDAPPAGPPHQVPSAGSGTSSYYGYP